MNCDRRCLHCMAHTIWPSASFPCSFLSLCAVNPGYRILLPVLYQDEGEDHRAWFALLSGRRERYLDSWQLLPLNTHPHDRLGVCGCGVVLPKMFSLSHDHQDQKRVLQFKSTDVHPRKEAQKLVFSLML